MEASSMVESVIMMLIYIVLIVGLVWLCFYVAARLEFPVPPQLANVVWLLVLLLIILLLWQTFGSQLHLGRR